MSRTCEHKWNWGLGGRGGILRLSNREQATKGCDHFYGGSWTLKAPCKDFNLAIVGRLGWMKWLKNGGRKTFIFHAIIPALYSFWWIFYWLRQSTFIFSMLESQSWQNKIVTKMGRLKRWWYLSKLLTITTIITFNFFTCPVKL